MATTEHKLRRRKWEHQKYFWFETVDLERRGGDLGLYDYHHSEIARKVIHFEKIQSVQDRLRLVPVIQKHLVGIQKILEVYNIDPAEDVRRTLKEINTWLPGHEIPMSSQSVRPKRAGLRGNGVGNPWRR